MLCCLGLFVGAAIGSMLGGPWTYTAPTIGFGLGLIGDMKLMRGRHAGHGGNEGGCCGGGSMYSRNVEKGGRDPVCGMEVDERKAKFKTEYAGKTYYFCAEKCKKKFEKDPKKFIK